MSNELLSAEREGELVRAWRDRGDRQALGQLVMSVRPFVLSIARRYRGPNTTEDLVASGLVGAVEAARRFDPDRGTRFLSYAAHWIRSAILSELRSQTDHGLGSFEAKVASLDHDDMLCERDVAMHPERVELGVDRELAARDAAATAKRALDGLDERSRRILTLRFLRNEEATLATVADEVGLSRERVRQIEASALTLLRKRLSRSGMGRCELLQA